MKTQLPHPGCLLHPDSRSLSAKCLFIFKFLFFPLIASVQLAKADLLTGLVAYYPFNGNANDASVNGNNGSAYGAIPTTDRFGNPNGAYYFNGDAYVQAPHHVATDAISSQLTLSAWVKIDVGTDYQVYGYRHIISKGATYLGSWANYAMGLSNPQQYTPAGSLQLEVSSASVSGTTLSSGIVVPQGDWHHVAITFESGLVTFYLDGVQVGTAISSTTPIRSSTQPLYIGCRYEHAGASKRGFFAGAIDEVRVYSRALATNEIVEMVRLGDGDSDSDGLPDWWEVNYGLNPLSPNFLRFGVGSDGDLSVSAGQTSFTDNVRTTVVGTNLAGATSLLVASTNGFRPSDLVLVIAIQDPNTILAQNAAGTYQFVRLAAVSNAALILNQTLNNSYTVSSSGRIQVLRVPEYNNLVVNGMLTCSAWDGTNGGVLALLCRSNLTISADGTIEASGKGFHGGNGVASTTDYQYGIAGERTLGVSTDRETNSLERVQGGGGAGKGADGSGGGGGYGGLGSDGGFGGDTRSDFGRGAQAFGTTTLSRVYFGGGGGGSGSHAQGRLGVAGGRGGGIILVGALNIMGAGTIASKGSAGQDGVFNSIDNSGSGGGGGAGGGIYLSGDIASNLQVFASGGTGGAGAPGGHHSINGGAGGAGRIRIDTTLPAALPNLSPAAGYVGDISTNNFPHVVYIDSDGDGLSDFDEFVLGTNPSSADTDHDGLSDFWEFSYFGNPTNAVAEADPDGDNLPNREEYLLGTNPLKPDTDDDGLTDYDEVFIYHTNPVVKDTDGDGMEDGDEVTAGRDPTVAGIRYSYDRTDRLVGAEYEKGLALGYRYDANGNLIRQGYLNLSQNTNGLPVLWRFLNGLSTTNSTGTNAPFADADGDGWSNYQEWRAGSNPLDAGSVPATNIVQTAPLATVLPATNTLGDLAAVTVRLWDAEGNASTPFLQYQISGTTNWQDATLVTLDDAAYSTNSRVAALPSGTNHVLVWNALTNLGVGVTTDILLRARAQDITLLGYWSAGTLFSVQTTANPDSDGDGIPDWWEIQYFGNISHNGMADSDGDGFTDLQEYIADTSPTNNLSYLHISSVQLVPGGVWIEWQGGIQATQNLQRLNDLSLTNWQNLLTNLPPTPISGSYTDLFGTNALQFYRIKAMR